MKRPLVWLTVIYILGITLSALIPAPLWLSFALMGISLAGALFGYLTKWRYNRYLLAVMICLAGFLAHQVAVDMGKSPLVKEAGHVVTLQGTVVREPIQKGDKVQYVVRMESRERAGSEQPAKGKLMLTVKTDQVKYSYGDRIKFKGKLELPPEAGNPGEFDYRRYLEGQGIPLTMHLYEDSGIDLLASNNANPVVKLSLMAKSKFLSITRQTLPAKEAAVVDGIIFGVTSRIDGKTQEVFRQTGVVHVLSVSGLHVALVLAIVFGFGKMCRLPKPINTVISLTILLLYGVMTGLGPAVLRSVIMGAVMLLGDVLRRERDWPTSLALSAFIILIIDPLALFNLGFLLSMTATWGILNITPWLNEKLVWLPNWLRNTLSVPIAAQLGTLPIIAYYFNFVSPVSLLANIIAVPLTSFILVLGFGAVITGLVTVPLAGLINYTTEALTDLFLWLVKLCSMLPGSVFYVSTPPLWTVFLWYGLLFALVNFSTVSGVRLRLVRYWQLYRGKIVISVLVVISLLVWSSALSADTGKLKVTFINVGEGDSILVETPDRRHMLVDCGPAGPNYDAGERVIVPYLRRLGVSKLDVLVLTHPHEDHVGGAKAVVEAMPVDYVIISPIKQDTDSYNSLLAKIKEKNISTVTGKTGTDIELDSNLKITVLQPEKMIKGTYSDLNNNSLVIRLEYGKNSFLFTGDIEKEAIEGLMASGLSLQAEVFKLPHHGSKNSLVTDFYRRIHPHYGVITVGKNRYGHPAKETVAELEKQGMEVLRTDTNGAVTFIGDGEKLTVELLKGAP